MAESFIEGFADQFVKGLDKNRAAAQQDFENQRQLAADQRASQLQSAQIDSLRVHKIDSAIEATNAQREQLRSQANADPAFHTDPQVRQQYLAQGQQLTDHYQELLRHKGGAQLTDFARGAAATQRKLASGETDFSKLSPQEAADFLAYHVNRPVSDILDTDGQKAPLGQALSRFHEGIARLQQDNGEELIGAANDLYGHELHGLLGQTAYDGVSKVVNAEFAAPVPQPGSPSDVLLTAKLTVRRPDGAIGTQIVPVLESHDGILAHPEQAQDARGSVTSLSHFFDQVGTLETLYKAVNTDPQVSDKLRQAIASGHDKTQQQLAFLTRQLGGDPDNYLPKRGELIVSPETGLPTFEAAPNQKVAFAPQGLAVAQLRANAAADLEREKQQNREELARIRAEQAGTGVVVQNTAPDGSLRTYIIDPKTHQVDEVNLQGKVTKLGTPDKAAGEGRAGAIQRVQNNRVLNSANEVIADLSNIVRLPIAASTGFLGTGVGGRDGQKGLFDVAAGALHQQITAEEDQAYRVVSAGLGRYLSLIEGSGLAGTSGFTKSASDQLSFAPGEDKLTRLTKVAQAAQITERGLESLRASGLNPEQTELADGLAKKLREVVPFTVLDVLTLGQSKKKTETLTDFAARKGLPQAPAGSAKPPSAGPVAKTDAAKTLTSQDVEAYAKLHNISPAEATGLLSGAGYTVK